MKKSIGALVVLVCIVMFSCSSNEDKKTVVTDSKYKIFEDDVMKLINAHRINLGLKPYIVSDYISSQAAEHVDYMIQKNSINHDGFFDRAANISKTLGSSTTGENVAAGQSTAEQVFNAWMDRDSGGGHQDNIESTVFTHFGLSIKSDANGRYFFCNIFVKI